VGTEIVHWTGLSSTVRVSVYVPAAQAYVVSSTRRWRSGMPHLVRDRSYRYGTWFHPLLLRDGAYEYPPNEWPP
jgi:hypothetical protein